MNVLPLGAKSNEYTILTAFDITVHWCIHVHIDNLCTAYFVIYQSCYPGVSVSLYSKDVCRIGISLLLLLLNVYHK